MSPQPTHFHPPEQIPLESQLPTSHSMSSGQMSAFASSNAYVPLTAEAGSCSSQYPVLPGQDFSMLPVNCACSPQMHANQ